MTINPNKRNFTISFSYDALSSRELAEPSAKLQIKTACVRIVFLMFQSSMYFCIFFNIMLLYCIFIISYCIVIIIGKTKQRKKKRTKKWITTTRLTNVTTARSPALNERTYYGMYKLFFIRHLSRNTIL